MPKVSGYEKDPVSLFKDLVAIQMNPSTLKALRRALLLPEPSTEADTESEDWDE